MKPKINFRTPVAKIVLGTSLLLAYFIHAEVNAECRPYDFNIAVDDYMIVYIDGLPITGLPNAFNWNAANRITLLCTTRLIAVQGLNFADVGGIRGSDNAGNILTDSSWKCTGIGYRGWEKVAFDDSSWPAAVITRSGNNRDIPGISRNSQWIWTKDWSFNSPDFSPNRNITAYCRKRLDANECALAFPENKCNSTMGRCVNTPTDYSCNCFQGYMNVDYKTCKDVDECALGFPENKCNLTMGRCVNMPADYRCICFQGYRNVNNHKCEHVDIICALGPPENKCNPTMGKCVNTSTGYRCICFDGYRNADDYTCEAILNYDKAAVILGVLLGFSLLLIVILIIFLILCLRRKSQIASAGLDNKIGKLNKDERFLERNPVSRNYEDLEFDGIGKENCYEEIKAESLNKY